MDKLAAKRCDKCGRQTFTDLDGCGWKCVACKTVLAALSPAPADPLVERLRKILPLLEDLETGRDCEDYAFAKGRGFQAMTYCPEAFEALHCVPEAAARLSEQAAEIERLRAALNKPEVEDFMGGVPLEAAHQRERWGSDHDAGKTPFDWFWLIGYLTQKAADAAVRGDAEKAKHHTISTAAALANWHAALSGGDNRMRPGIEPPRAALGSDDNG